MNLLGRSEVPSEGTAINQNVRPAAIFGRLKTVAVILLKIIALLGLLYIFVCSLTLLSSAFRLLGGKELGKAFQSDVILSNPMADVMIGVMVTAFIHSSSTVTSIAVAMVNAQSLTVQQGVYIVMGANVGTAVTSALVALFSSADREEFRRAFAAATIHDLYNWLGVLVFLPIEWAAASITGTGFLTFVSGQMIPRSSNESFQDEFEFLSAIIDPLTDKIIRLDKTAILDFAVGKNVSANQTVAKHYCNGTWCPYLFNFDWSDRSIGGLLFVISLVVLASCLVGIVKVLNSVLGKQAKGALRRVLNAEFPGRLAWLTGYFCILVGMGITFVIQSSTVFTSTLIPLCAADILSLERFFVFEIGADVGTTGTAILAALALSDLGAALQLALCHLLFNVFSIFVFYSIPPVRAIPLAMARYFGDTTAKYRWFAFLYIAVLFFFFPATVFLLSLAGWPYLLAFGAVTVSAAAFVGIVNRMQSRCPHCLPPPLRTWQWLPACLRSWDPMDRVVVRLLSCICPESCKRKYRVGVVPVETWPGVASAIPETKF